MMTKEEYKKELIRMWDSIRVTNKGSEFCYGLSCSECPLDQTGGCDYPINAIAMAESVEKWSNEHPPKKYKVSKLEYDIMRAAIDYSCEEEAFKDVDILYELLINGYFKGAKSSDKVIDFFKNCEVSDDV